MRPILQHGSVAGCPSASRGRPPRLADATPGIYLRRFR
jgi:hypothetical protein